MIRKFTPSAIKKKAFTLAEVLITLAIIGVVASITIPSVIVNTQQNEFKTGLKKAVSVLNQAITMTQALDGVSPYDISMSTFDVARVDGVATGKYPASSIEELSNNSLYSVLSKHMSLIKTTGAFVNGKENNGVANRQYANIAFYTTDGMRFEIPVVGPEEPLEMHETKPGSTSEHYEIPRNMQQMIVKVFGEPACGSLGLASNPDDTQAPPCIIMVDVNGDRKPNPSNYEIKENGAMEHSGYTYAMPNDKRIKDVFAIMITESKAIPFGVAAQRAMYQARDKK